MIRNLQVLLAFCLFLLTVTCNADTVILDAIADNTIYQDNTDFSNGAGDFIFAGNNGGNAPRRSLIRFDLSSIPTNATIDNVTFTAFLSQGNMGVVNVSLNQLTADWGESSSDAPGGEGGGTAAAPGDATWNENFFGSSSWANPGGDFLAGASATTAIGDVASYQWSSAGLVNDVQGWLMDPNSNFGWMLIGDESSAGTSKRFNSRTNSNSPFLTVEFTSVPEPSLALFLTVGLIGVSTIRRRAN